MIDIGSLALAIVDIVALSGIAIAIHWLGRGEGSSLVGLFSIPSDPPWSRGVQEEELQPWRIERLSRRAATADRARVIQPRMATTDAGRRSSAVVD